MKTKIDWPESPEAIRAEVIKDLKTFKGGKYPGPNGGFKKMRDNSAIDDPIQYDEARQGY